MNHIDLFSGIGGFAYAAQQVWGDEYHNMLFCDNNIFCQEVLKKNFGKDSLIYGDIKELTRERFIADTECMRELQSERGKQNEWRRIGYEIDLLTGGFPCQPFSQAGKRKGASDDRYLWPEMLRVIQDFKPTWVIAENVLGILTIEGGLVFESVCLDLEGEGYEVQPFIIPAVAKNAPHRRDRVWIVAHRNDTRSRTLTDGVDKDRQKENEGRQEQPFGGIDGQSSNAPDTAGERLQGHLCEQGKIGCDARPSSKSGSGFSDWERNWLEVATEFCGVDDGLPAELHGLKLSKARHRVERLKALGNSIVPQVAMEIMKAIQEAERIMP